jgi:hypothetical protein
MPKDNAEKRLKSARRIRWTARGFSIFVAVVWVVMGIVPTFFEPPAWTFEDRMMAGLTTACLVSILTARFHEGVGGALLVLCGVAQSTSAHFAAGHSIALAISGGPFFLLGVLFLLVRRRSAEWPIERQLARRCFSNQLTISTLARDPCSSWYPSSPRNSCPVPGIARQFTAFPLS